MLSGVEAYDEQKNKIATDPHGKTLIKNELIVELVRAGIKI